MRIPPLHELRAFEAAARHLSYTRAAEELHLTHGAVSHALRSLEDRIGRPLFRRRANAMLLTDDGRRLVVHVRAGLERLTRGFEDVLLTHARTTSVTVSALPAFAARWLLPRLPDFGRRHPDVLVSIEATPSLVDFTVSAADLAIRYGPGGWNGVEAELLMEELLFPVCSPGLLARTPIETPGDLLSATLLRHPRESWRSWLDAVGLDAPEPLQGPLIDDAGLLVQSAVAGQGVALARGALVEEELRDGRLGRLFEQAVKSAFGWFVVWPTGETLSPGAQTFLSWLCHAGANRRSAHARSSGCERRCDPV